MILDDYFDQNYEFSCGFTVLYSIKIINTDCGRVNFPVSEKLHLALYLIHGHFPTMLSLRNILVESARIARGKVLPLSSLKAADYNGVVFPGGFGAAKNL